MSNEDQDKNIQERAKEDIKNAQDENQNDDIISPEEQMLSDEVDYSEKNEDERKKSLEEKLDSLASEDKKRLFQAQMRIKKLTQGELTNGKLAFLTLLSMAISTFGPLSLFAAFPLTLIFLLYEGRKSYLATSFGFLIMAILTSFGLIQSGFAGVYFVSLFFSLAINKVIRADIAPVRAMIYLAVGFFCVLGITGVIIVSNLEGTIMAEIEKNISQAFLLIQKENQQLLTAGGKEARMLQDVLDNPKALATQIYNWAPSAIFVGVFVVVWGNLLLVLRNQIFWQHITPYKYTIRSLIKFKVPEGLVWLVIASLACFIGGEYFKESFLDNEALKVFSGNILYGIGVFYFFQGFGIYLDALTMFGIFGFFRSILVMITLFTAWKYIAVVGVFDLWFNFRKNLRKLVNNKEK